MKTDNVDSSPTKTTQKIMKGCKMQESLGSPYCGKYGYLCNECKATLSAKKEEWQNEIEFLRRCLIENILVYKTVGLVNTTVNSWIKERLKELHKAVKLANG